MTDSHTEPAAKQPASSEPTPADDQAAQQPETSPERPGAAWLPDVITTVAAVVLALVVGAVLIALSDEQAAGALPYVFTYPQDFFSFAGQAIWNSYSALVSGSIG